MQKLYNDLGMSFLYSQTKKLVSAYSMVFVFLQQKIEEQEQFISKQNETIEDFAERKRRVNGGFKTKK